MQELIHQLGIDWRLIIAQMINFLILLAILYKFAYRPLITILEERRKKIEKSITDAKLVEENLNQATRERGEIVAAARQEAGRIVEESKLAATNHKNAVIVEAKSEADKIIREAGQALKAEKEMMMNEARADLSNLVLQATEKVLRGVMTKEINQKYVETVVKDIS